MKLLKLNTKNHAKIITQAVKTLQQAGLIIYPTETCYGLGADATSQPAIDKLLAYKTFRQGKPLSIAVANQTMAKKYVKLNSSAKSLYQNFLPGPLTIISKSRGRVARGVESDSQTLGIRIPDYPLVIKIVKKLNHPITATSANASYKKRPYSIKDILNNTSKKQQSLIDLIINAGSLAKNPPSTVVDTTLDDPLILRQGPVSLTTTQSLTTHSPQQTSDLAQTLMLKHWNQLLKQPLMFLLIGQLGAGKTQFCKGIGQFLHIRTHITSPTYTILKEYPYNRHQTKGQFLHLDTWRLHHLSELNQLNLTQQLKPKTILAVEWASRSLKPLLNLAQKTQTQVITIKLQPIKNQPNSRNISILA